jgi:hypothetical protein
MTILFAALRWTLMALDGHPDTSAVWSLTGAKQTLHQWVEIDAIDRGCVKTRC